MEQSTRYISRRNILEEILAYPRPQNPGHPLVLRGLLLAVRFRDRAISAVGSESCPYSRGPSRRLLYPSIVLRGIPVQSLICGPAFHGTQRSVTECTWLSVVVETNSNARWLPLLFRMPTRGKTVIPRIILFGRLWRGRRWRPVVHRRVRALRSCRRTPIFTVER
jgi:hypothetical protein